MNNSTQGAAIFEQTSTRLRDVQNEICNALQDLDGTGIFVPDTWARPGGGGGESRVLQDGAVFEKAGVNFSRVEGTLTSDFAAQLPGSGTTFRATGVSLVLHPRSPWIPTTHANVRCIEKGDRMWFGGGADLTPYYFDRSDAVHFHRTLKAVCDQHDPIANYRQFKNWCDDYFYLPHRKETRGIGGIFFDYLDGSVSSRGGSAGKPASAILASADEKTDLEAAQAFTLAVGRAVVSAYCPIAEKHRTQRWTEEQRHWQLQRRGRYVEFNLLYDRGTIFGLKTEGRTESILMSLPPEVRWDYNAVPAAGSPEADLVAALRATDWLDAEK